MTLLSIQRGLPEFVYIMNQQAHFSYHVELACSFLGHLSRNNLNLYCLRQGAHTKVGIGETPSGLSRKRGRFSSLEKFEEAFDTALHSMQTRKAHKLWDYRAADVLAIFCGRPKGPTFMPIYWIFWCTCHYYDLITPKHQPIQSGAPSATVWP